MLSAEIELHYSKYLNEICDCRLVSPQNYVSVYVCIPLKLVKYQANTIK